MPAGAEVLIIGVGNRFRGDDAAGLEAAARLKSAGCAGIEICEHSGEAGSLVDLWEGRPLVYIIDAVCSGGVPGTVRRLDASSEPLPAEWLDVSTHSFGLGQAVELARVLDRLPEQLIVFGIEGRGFGEDQALSEEALCAVEEVALQLVRELQELQAIRS